jgi:NAD(P)-dependent dehydrogenase (short-subunit alcohol dehydrogenase family)
MKTVLITGCSSGYGLETARQFHARGWNVIATMRRPREGILPRSDRLRVMSLDVRDSASIAAAVAVSGPIDVLVNNAGVGGAGRRTWEQAPDEWWRVVEINLRGAFLCCRAVIPGMLDRGRGRIVNVASGAAYLPGSRGTSYAASKAGLHRFTEVLANELASTGVFAFSISPGLVRTDMTAENFPDDAPWTPPELAPRLVHELASGRLDRLAGRYLHAEHDDVDDLAARADEIVEADLNAIRLRR